MKIMVSGSSGLIGSALVKNIQSAGYQVVKLPRTYENPICFSGVHAVIHLAGENIADGRWTASRKLRIEHSRTRATRQLTDQLAHSTEKPSVFVCASAIGYYGNRGNELLDEESRGGEGFLPMLCQKWEVATRPAREAGIRTINIRTGIVLSKEGGALKKMLTPFKLGCGGIIGNGRQYMSWISLVDVINAIRFLIDDTSIQGAVNLVSPNPLTNREFTKTLGKVLRRPTLFPLPAIAAHLIFGEMADELLLGSCRVVPKKLLNAGYTFQHSDLRTILDKIALK